LGVLQDYNKAVEFYEKASEKGHAFSQFQLGSHYALGLGVTKDLIKSHMWFNVAASSGHERAAKSRDQLTEILTQHQISEARALAKDWINNNRE